MGNALPNPFWLFVILAGVVIVSSWLGAMAGMSAEDPATGDVIEVESLLTAANLQRMVTEAVDNFVTFAPLGLILVCMLGVAVAENSGFIGAAIRGAVSKVSSAGFNSSLILNITDVLLAAVVTGVTELFIVKHTKRTIDEDAINYEAASFTKPARDDGEYGADADDADAGTTDTAGTADAEAADDDGNGTAEASESNGDPKPKEELRDELELDPEESRALKIAGFTALAVVAA